MDFTQILLLSFPILEFFGRGGGGGSSSGGGGSSSSSSSSGGGGSSSGSSTSGGDIWFFLAFVGGMITFVLMAMLSKILRDKFSILKASLLSWLIVIIFSGCLFFIIGIYSIVFLFFTAFGACLGLYSKQGRTYVPYVEQKRQKAEIIDNSWDIEKLKKQVSETFYKFQADWSNNDSASMQSYLSPQYFHRNKLVILALKQLHRRNIVKNPKINELSLIKVNDEKDNSGDYFIMEVDAIATDTLYDEKNKELLFTDKREFFEYWRFVRSGNGWLLDSIGQSTDDSDMHNDSLKRFAESNNYFYSSDWGWLLLPSSGYLFRRGQFGLSDINNHIIGIYKDSLVQLYNFLPGVYSLSDADFSPKNYIIAQAAIPKDYGNIVVRNRRFLSRRPKGLRRVKMEWGDFNKKYEVWASDLEKVTSFELLNPSFMVKLQELPFDINIEVVDNLIYLYGAEVQALSKNYQILLDVLYQAFKEMRM